MPFKQHSVVNRLKVSRLLISLLPRCLLLLAFPLLSQSVWADVEDASHISLMEFDVTYTTTVSNVSKDSKILRVWMPIPPESDDQEIEGLEVASPVPHEIRSDKTYGNKMVFVEAGAESVPLSIVSRYRVVRRRSRRTPATLDDEAKQKYLALSPRVKITAEIRSFVQKVVGQRRLPVVVGRKVFDALIDLLSYDKMIPGCGTGDTEWIFKHRRGKCDDYHSLFMAMMISEGIPVRWEQGFPLPVPTTQESQRGRLEGDCSGAHCWASFHDGRGWIPVDVSEADKHPELADFYFGNLTPNRFKISEGRSIILDPPQSGDPLNSFAYAYAEADGIPLIYEANYVNTIEFEVDLIEMD